MIICIELEGEQLEVEVTHYKQGTPATFHDPAEGGEIEWEFADPAVHALYQALGSNDDNIEQLVWDECERSAKEDADELQLARAGV